MKKVTSKHLDREQVTDPMKTITESMKERGKNEMTRIEKEEFVNRIKGMSQEELELVVEIIPVDLCVTRVNKELERLRTFENSVKWAVNGGIL